MWAAVLGRADVVALLVSFGFGFDIDAKGRTDGVGTTEWETALRSMRTWCVVPLLLLR